MSVNVAAKPGADAQDAAAAAAILKAVDKEKLQQKLGVKVVGDATATVNPDNTVSWSFPVEESSLKPPVQAGEVSIGQGKLQDVSPAPSPPPSTDGDGGDGGGGGGGGGGGDLNGDLESSQTKKDESL